MRKGLVALVRVRGTEVGAVSAIVLNDEKPHDQTCCGERHGQGEPDRELQSGVHACDRRGVCECGGCQLNDAPPRRWALELYKARVQRPAL